MDKKSMKNTSQQLRLLLREMAKNPHLAKGVQGFGGSKQQFDDEWEKIRKELNSLGPSIKTVAGWKRVWIALKSRTKGKLAANASKLRRMRVRQFCLVRLNPIEQQVEKILSMLTNVPNSGIDVPSFDVPAENAISHGPSRTPMSCKDKRLRLMEEQTALLRNACNELKYISSLLERITDGQRQIVDVQCQTLAIWNDVLVQEHQNNDALERIAQALERVSIQGVFGLFLC